MNELTERLIDDFINDLNREKKPEIYKQGVLTPEDEKLLETIRSVKRIKNRYGKKYPVRKKNAFLKLASSVAAVFLILGLLTGIIPFGGNNPPTGFLQAVAKSYEDLRSYSGTVEIKSLQNGKINYLEKIEIQFKKPGMYKAIHNFQEVTLKYISDGNRLITITPGQITVENIFPQKELWRYHIGTPIWELITAVEKHRDGTEKILGRNAVVYSYRGDKNESFNKIWIDEDTKLPLKVELNLPAGRKLIKQFKEITINPSLNNQQFKYTFEKGDNIKLLNKTATLSEVKTIFGKQKINSIIKAVPEEFKFFKAGLMDKTRYELVLRYQGKRENDFLDIYYSTRPGEFVYTPESETMKLKEGFVDINSHAINVFKIYHGKTNIARWVTKDNELFLVTNQPVSLLKEVLETISGCKLQTVTGEELLKEGIEPPIQKKGH